ncbi:MAG: hypothetical protein IEMM0006_2071 [bacterium]|nr:MAG: hypothetical protein IEMM0006_2071 [bacterium]
MATKEETTKFLQEFERSFNPVNIQMSPIPVSVLGHGEISTVVTFEESDFSNEAFKRLPLFSTAEEVEDYCNLYLEYNQLLKDVGIETPVSHAYWVKGHKGRFVAYLSQERLPREAIGNKIIQQHSREESLILLRLVLDKMRKLWQQNRDNNELILGLDSQISNWAIKNYDSRQDISEESSLLFIDTSTPFIRKNGVEQMNALLFLQSAPPVMRPVLRKFFLQDIMDRYYDFRLVLIDLIANLYKEQCADLIPDWLEVANRENQEFLSGNTITEKEVEKYYKEDKFIWQLFLGVRRANRFMNTKILGNRYEFTLPGEIER